MPLRAERRKNFATVATATEGTVHVVAISHRHEGLNRLSQQYRLVHTDPLERQRHQRFGQRGIRTGLRQRLFALRQPQSSDHSSSFLPCPTSTSFFSSFAYSRSGPAAAATVAIQLEVGRHSRSPGALETLDRRVQRRQVLDFPFDLFPLGQRVDEEALGLGIDGGDQLAVALGHQRLALACRHSQPALGVHIDMLHPRRTSPLIPTEGFL